MKLKDILHFDPSIFTNSSDDAEMNTAINSILPLLTSKKSIKLYIDKECMETTVVRELVSKVFVPISGSIILNRTHSTWVDKKYTENDDVTSGNLGIGCNLTTWYGTPDLRIRGISADSELNIFL